MSDSLISSRFTSRAGIDALARDTDDELSDNLGCFGWFRGVRERAVMLELRRKDGSILAIGYAWLERIEFNPSEGITLHGCGQRIRIEGRNLNGPSATHARLFDGLVRHRVPWVQEMSRADELLADKSCCVIELISW